MCDLNSFDSFCVDCSGDSTKSFCKPIRVTFLFSFYNRYRCRKQKRVGMTITVHKSQDQLCVADNMQLFSYAFVNSLKMMELFRSVDVGRYHNSNFLCLYYLFTAWFFSHNERSLIICSSPGWSSAILYNYFTHDV